MFVGLEHTAIASPNPRNLAQWYADHLGFHINFEYDGNYFVRAQNGSMLEIILPKVRAPRRKCATKAFATWPSKSPTRRRA